MSASTELLRARTRPWLEPISQDKPSGVQAKHDPAYEAVSTEVAKLESPASDAVDWAGVVRGSGQLLQHTTKDLWLASYLAYGMYMTEGLSGALTGMVVLAEVTDQYWPTLFPDAKRLRGRANAVTWFVERMGRVLPSVKVTPADADLLGQLSEAAARLAELSRARFEGQGPAFGPLLEGVMRLRASLQTPEPAQAPAAPAQPAAAQPPATVAQAPASLSLPTPSAELTSPEAATDFLRNVGGSLVSAAGLVRRANTADPLAYRMLRTGLWLHLSQPPAPGANARTSLPPFPPALRERLERMATHARWAELLEEAESALVQHRFALELQRQVANALAGLGPTHAGAREALVLELAALLRRMPGVMELVASDGTPLTDAATKQWLQTEVLSRVVPAPGSGVSAPPAQRVFIPPLQSETPPAPGAVAGLEEEARVLFEAGKPEEALQRLQTAVNAATTGRARFVARLSLARMCANSGNLLLARTLYGWLDEECSARQLDAWEPTLAAACLEGFLTCALAQTNFTGRLEMDSQLRYRRLAQLDAPAALRVRVERLEATAESPPDTTAS
ncbi:type VI secretion system protein TssA [Corallococcus sp. ZKHCc1 1396]|uniref:Type VI secretion system protein TssA n=2 Tax=Corallococcus soli TaxID=2710757 RepID=A0ABR9PM59_9BACT|nr:type VI secretion system protein TssA [Corallococcus soli]MBE4748965.1 type VI secretion system protein TssA [Corallococcus soli]